MIIILILKFLLTSKVGILFYLVLKFKHLLKYLSIATSRPGSRTDVLKIVGMELSSEDN